MEVRQPLAGKRHCKFAVDVCLLAGIGINTVLDIRGTGACVNPNLLQPGVGLPQEVGDNPAHLLEQQLLLLHPTISPCPTRHLLVTSGFINLPLLGCGSFAWECHCQRGHPDPRWSVSSIAGASLVELLQWSLIVFVSELMVLDSPV